MSLRQMFSSRTRPTLVKEDPGGVFTPRRLPPAGNKGQLVRPILDNGPDPRQSGYWDGLATRTALELSPFGAPLSIRVGMKGDPTVSYYGDPGPLGGIPAPSHGAKNSFPSLNADQALPGSTSPPITATTLQQLLGDFQ